MCKHLNQGTKPACSFGLIVALVLAITVVTALRIQPIKERSSDMVDERAVRVALATDLGQAALVQGIGIGGVGSSDVQRMPILADIEALLGSAELGLMDAALTPASADSHSRP